MSGGQRDTGDRVTLAALARQKAAGEPVVMVTAYDFPSARARVIAYLGEQLTLLDGRAVTPEESLAAVRLCTLQDAVVKIAASNARLALKLRRALQLSAVHRELHQIHFFGKKNEPI